MWHKWSRSLTRLTWKPVSLTLRKDKLLTACLLGPQWMPHNRRPHPSAFSPSGMSQNQLYQRTGMSVPVILTFWMPSSFTHTFEKICLKILLRTKAKNRMAPIRSLWLISSKIAVASSRRVSTDVRDSLESWKEGRAGMNSEKQKPELLSLKPMWIIPNWPSDVTLRQWVLFLTRSNPTH